MSETTNAPEETPEAANKLASTKTFVKKTLTRVGVPVLLAGAALVVISRKRSSDDSTEE